MSDRGTGEGTDLLHLDFAANGGASFFIRDCYSTLR